LNSLLTLHPLLSSARVPLQATPRDCTCTGGLRNISLQHSRTVRSSFSCAVPDMPHLPHRWFCPGLGEGRIESSLLLVPIVLISLLVGADVARGFQTEGPGPDAGGPPLTTTRDAGRPVLESELIQPVRAHIAATSQWRPEEIEVLSVRSPGGLRIPEGTPAFRVAQKAAPANYRGALLPIEISVNGRFHRTAWITADVRIRAIVVRALRRLEYGSALTEGDLELAPMEIANTRNTYIRNIHEAVDRVLRHPVATGEPLTRTTLADPLAVRSGETVRVRLQRSGIHLTALARAEQNGRLGQVIRIRNLDFSRTLKAQVVGRGEVAVQ